MRETSGQGRDDWIEAFDSCCDGLKKITSARNRGETNTLAPFYAHASEMWLLIDRAPEDLDIESRVIANLLVGDYLRDHRKHAA